jgi:hypothetical protein
VLGSGLSRARTWVVGSKRGYAHTFAEEAYEDIPSAYGYSASPYHSRLGVSDGRSRDYWTLYITVFGLVTSALTVHMLALVRPHLLCNQVHFLSLTNDCPSL